MVMKDETVVFHPFAWKSAPSGRPDVRVPLSQRIEAREPLADLMRNYGAPNFTLMIKAGPSAFGLDLHYSISANVIWWICG